MLNWEVNSKIRFMARISRRSAIGSGLALAAVGAIGFGAWPRMDGYRDQAKQQRHLLADNPGLQDPVRMAKLAANSHNTQLLTFRLADQRVTILPDFSRRTAVVGPDDHHLYVRLGCAAWNPVIAATAQGRAAEVVTGSGAELRIGIALSAAKPRLDTLYKAIPLRQTTRAVYDRQPISGADMALLAAAART